MPGPNPPSPVIVKYTPADPDPWSQVPGKKIHVNNGSTTINWTIQVIPASAGSIVFNMATATPGIEFTGTGNDVWPGTTPSGSANAWSSTVDNQLVKGNNPLSFHYKVNALYTPNGGTQQAVTFDPDVQEDPPTIVFQ
jgi:hypothetical protein